MTDTPTTPAAVLRAARTLIATPERWTKRAYRKDAAGNMCEPEQAVCRCAEGALCDSDGTDDEWWRAYDVFRDAIGLDSIALWNDAPERTHADVLAAFDRAIALAEATP